MKRTPLDDHARRQALHSPRILAALSRLRTEQIEFTEISPGQYLVAGRFEYWPAAGNWHQTGGGQTGGEVASLIAAVRALP
jgi:hypothetical protein